MKGKLKIFSLVLSLIMAASALSLVACGKEKENGASSEFDETSIVLSFSAMSDVHQQLNKQDVSDKLVNALDYAEELNGKPLDLALFAGDLTEETWRAPISEEYSETYNADIQMFKTAVEKALDLSETAVFYALGNHDNDSSTNADRERMARIPALFRSQLGEAFFTADAEDSDIDAGRRHAVVNGYHFLAVHPDSYWTLRGYSDETLKWLDDQLKAITSANPDQYVFVVAHPPIYETVFSSYRSDWADRDVSEVLQKYPQAMYFSGHIHNVLQDEIQLSQNGYYTAMDCGSVKYTSMMNDVNDAGTLEFDNNVGTRQTDFSQGLLVQVDKNGNVRVIRCDYYKHRPIKDAWEFEYPKKDNSHLEKYDNLTRESTTTAPVFAEDAKATAKREGNRVTISWDAATDDDMVRYYRITAYKKVDGKKTKVETYNIGTMTYQYTSVSEMPDTMSYTFMSSFEGEFVFEIVGVDVWNKSGKPISATVTL